jgi:hypothetical protein
MSCLHCDATYQHGRFCNRCGKQLPPAALVERRTPLTRRFRSGGDTLPGGRGREVVAAPRASGHDDAAVPAAVIRRMYDTAMERAAVHSRPSLQRYLAVLVTP